MTVLAVDTAGTECSVALQVAAGADPIDRLYSRSEIWGRAQSEKILPLIEQLFLDAEIGYQSLNRIICIMGPGSFTGLRVGVALAKGLSLASGAEVLGVFRTAALANGFVDAGYFTAEACRFAAVIDAGRGDYYVEPFVFHDGVLESLAAPHIILHDACDVFIEKFQITKIVALQGEGVADLSYWPNFVVIHEQKLGAEHLFDLAPVWYAHNEAVKPLYVRLPDAKPQQGKALERFC